MMPLPQLWAVCFFLMIIMLGLDTQVRAGCDVVVWLHCRLQHHINLSANALSSSVAQFVSLEALMTSVTDLYPHLIRRGHRRELLLLFVCIVCFLVGLVMITPVGHALLVRVCVCFMSLRCQWSCWLFSGYDAALTSVFSAVCAAGWSVCVPDLWPLLLQWSQPAPALHLPVPGHRLGLRYESQLVCLSSSSLHSSFSTHCYLFLFTSSSSLHSLSSLNFVLLFTFSLLIHFFCALLFNSHPLPFIFFPFLFSF